MKYIEVYIYITFVGVHRPPSCVVLRPPRLFALRDFAGSTWVFAWVVACGRPSSGLPWTVLTLAVQSKLGLLGQ